MIMAEQVSDDTVRETTLNASFSAAGTTVDETQGCVQDCRDVPGSPWCCGPPDAAAFKGWNGKSKVDEPSRAVVCDQPMS